MKNRAEIEQKNSVKFPGCEKLIKLFVQFYLNMSVPDPKIGVALNMPQKKNPFFDSTWLLLNLYVFYLSRLYTKKHSTHWIKN